ncbi:uncharacterized protein LOC115053875 isoform X3 [Echeneis naucrates]|uniref:uncharacterized protein LOC115053875 isoform X3 n=1 Tax=Echeneis naucrates TaxID=173247 RepID=UPI0011143600|nr:uncharacterized protein LOC115053875 isoform X3 [Echeneis naucrates]
MIGSLNFLAVMLTVTFTASVSLLSLLCLRCKRRSKVIQEENQTYHLQTFQRGGSVFAVMQSKAVTRTNHISSATVASQETFSQDLNDDQADYENISQTGIPHIAMAPAESLYVAPLPNAVYENAQSETTTNDAEQVQGVYANFIQSLTIDEDKEDYENSEFLSQVIPEDDEPDYVNELGDCT